MHAVAPNAPPGPRFLQALDHVDDPADGTYIAECPICRELLLIDQAAGQWTLNCDGDCTHDELVGWLGITDLRSDTTTEDRAWVALCLATTADVWAALLAGEPVNAAALDADYLRRFKAAGIIP